MDNITDSMPMLVVKLPGEVHVISIVQIRMLAAGNIYNGDKDKLIQILAGALKDCYNYTYQ